MWRLLVRAGRGSRIRAMSGGAIRPVAQTIRRLKLRAPDFLHAGRGIFNRHRRRSIAPLARPSLCQSLAQFASSGPVGARDRGREQVAGRNATACRAPFATEDGAVTVGRDARARDRGHRAGRRGPWLQRRYPPLPRQSFTSGTSGRTPSLGGCSRRMSRLRAGRRRLRAVTGLGSRAGDPAGDRRAKA